MIAMFRVSVLRFVAAALAALAALAPAAIHAQPAGYPNKPIRFVVPYAAGGLPALPRRDCARARRPDGP